MSTGKFKKSGFTLIEVLIAMAILASGLLSVFYMFPLALRQLRLSKLLMDASFLAKKKLEEVKTYNGAGEDKGEEKNFSWQVSWGEEKILEGINLRRFALRVESKVLPKISEEFITYLPLESD